MPSHFYHRSPKSSRKKIVSLAVAAIAAQGALGGALLRPLWAQEAAQDVPGAETQAAPELDAIRGANETQAQELWKQLQEHSAELEATDARSAITLYQKFFEAGAGRFPSVGVQIALRIARLWQVDLKDYDKAIEIYDWALGLYRNRPEAVQLQQGRLAAEQTQKKAEAAQGSKQPRAPQRPGTAPLVVPVPQSPDGGRLGVGVPLSSGQGRLGIGLSSPANAGKIGIGLPSTGNSKSLAVAAPPTHGDALGWNPGSDRCVTALAQEPDGSLWVATEDSGVWHYDPSVTRAQDRWHQFTAKDGLGDDSAYALAVDRQNRVWAGTQSDGVSVWNGQAWKNYGVLDGPLGERVFAIKVCPTDGDVWIATNAGLSRYSVKNDSWSYITRADGLPSDQVQAIAFDQSGNIVVGTQCDGVALAQAKDGYKTWRQVKGPEQMPTTPTGKGLPSSLINDVLVAKDGTIYAATTTGMAWSSDSGANWSFVRGQDYADKVRGLLSGPPISWKEAPGAVLAEDYVSCLAEDEAGGIWLGHWQAGSERVQMQSGSAGVSPKEVSQRQNNGLVRSILSQSDGALLLARYDEGLSQSLLGGTKVKGQLLHSATSTLSPTFPSYAKAPKTEDLEAIIKRVQAYDKPFMKGAAAYLGEDWATQGDWVGRYGRRYAMLCAVNSPDDHKSIADANYAVVGSIGPYHQDSLRRWVHSLTTDNPKSLYDPFLGYRRQAEWDDHGEAYPLTHEGPDIWIMVRVPPGLHRISLYFFNKDGHEDANRLRDYTIELKPYTPKIEDAVKQPTLARARVRDFWGGVYKQFIVRGPEDAPVPEGFLTKPVTRFYIRIVKGGSLNVILSGVFVDGLSAAPLQSSIGSASAFKASLPWLGGVSYNPPYPSVLNTNLTQSEIQLKAPVELWSALDQAYARDGSQAFQTYGRLLALRAVANLQRTEPTKDLSSLLGYWRWRLKLWTPQDRQDFKEVMDQAYNSLKQQQVIKPAGGQKSPTADSVIRSMLDNKQPKERK
jgi:sugar lactone lactonase YvrE